MNPIQNQFASIEQVTNQYLDNRTKATKASDYAGLSFQELLAQKTAPAESGELKFSKHALQRLDERDISLSSEQSERLSQGVSMAGEKGIKDSLVLVDSLAFIVNIPNNTVITAMGADESTEHVYTNIDGAVIV